MLLGQYANFTFPAVACPSGATTALLRAHIDNPNAGDWEAWFNDRPVFGSRTPPLPIAGCSPHGKTLSWDIPVAYIKEGDNHLEFRSKDTEASIMDYLELAIRRG